MQELRFELALDMPRSEEQPPGEGDVPRGKEAGARGHSRTSEQGRPGMDSVLYSPGAPLLVPLKDSNSVNENGRAMSLVWLLLRICQ